MLPALTAFACSASPNPLPRAAAGAPAISILTYNVNFEQFTLDTVDAVLSADADVVALQETHAQWEAAFRERAVAYPFIEFRDHGPDGGMGILSRFPVTTAGWLASPVDRFPAWGLVLETPIGALDALLVHLHPPLDEHGLFTGYFTTGGQRVAEIEAHLTRFDRAPDLLVGDFNEGEGGAIDRIEAAGLRDAAFAFPPAIRTWSWTTQFGEREGRPDHVFHSPDLAPVSVEVMEAGGSDHRPLLVRLARR